MLHKIAIVGVAVWTAAVASAAALTFTLHRPLVSPSMFATEPTHTMKLAPPVVIEPPIAIAPAAPAVSEVAPAPRPAVRPVARLARKAAPPAAAAEPVAEPPAPKCTEWRNLEQGVGGAKVRTCE